MKTLTMLTAALLLLAAAAAPLTAEARSRGKHLDRHRHSETVLRADAYSPGFSISIAIPGSWAPPRKHYRPPRRVWAPGHWEYERVWVPGRYERVWVPGWYDRHDGWRSGYWTMHERGGEYREKRVRREGRYR
jgi:hypothetical protein